MNEIKKYMKKKNVTLLCPLNSEGIKILEFNQFEKFNKAPFIIDAYLENHLYEKNINSKNN